MTSSIDQTEVAKFDALAAQWWNPAGPMRPLHQMNPARMEWITARIARHFGPGPVRVLDVGCGAGLAAETMAEYGLDVTGLDAAPDVIAAARTHAEGRGLALTYRQGSAEDLVAAGEKFQVVTCLEVIEHVTDTDAFLKTLAGLLTADGLLFLSTLNRTAKSWLIAKVGAEYVLRMLPVGTHDWKRFIPPAQLADGLRRVGLRMADSAGLAPSLPCGNWRTGTNLSINYLAMATP